MSGQGGHNKPGAGGLTTTGICSPRCVGAGSSGARGGQGCAPSRGSTGVPSCHLQLLGLQESGACGSPLSLCLWGHTTFSSSVSVPGVSLVRTPRQSQVISCTDPCLHPQRLIPNTVPLTRPRDWGVATMQPTTPAPAMRPGRRLLLLGLKTERAEDRGPTPARADTHRTAPRLSGFLCGGGSLSSGRSGARIRACRLLA